MLDDYTIEKWSSDESDNMTEKEFKKIRETQSCHDLSNVTDNYLEERKSSHTQHERVS